MARWEHITAIAISKGIIQLIEPNGSIGFYAQRGVKTMAPGRLAVALEKGLIDPRVSGIPELPKNYSITFEDEEIMGKAEATFKY